jgi:phosphatidylglycerol lysyltransferase
MKPTRNSVNRLTSEGFVSRIYTAPVPEGVLQKLEWVSTQWLTDLREKEVAFTQGVFNKSILKGNTIITIEDAEEKIYAFLNLIPDYAPGEATYDLIRKIPDAPNGVLDMLLVKTFLYLKEIGFQKVNMGLAPLSGMARTNLKERAIHFAYENIRLLGHFKGLRKYKEKFYPEWEKRFLVYDHNYHLLQIPNALKKVSEST